QEPEAGNVPFAALLAPLVSPDNNSNLRRLHTITILGADVSVGNHRRGVFFKASDADILFRRTRKGVVQSVASAKIAYGDYESLVGAQLSFSKESPTIDGEITFSQLMPATLASLFTDN